MSPLGALRVPDDGPIPFENRSELLDEAGPLFVMGCPRSGTTFLVDALAELPNTAAWSGVLVPDRMCHVVGSGALPADVLEDVLYAWRAALWKPFHGRLTSRRFHVANAIRHPGAARREAALLGGRATLDPADYRMVYKEPFLAFAAGPLARHFRSARFVHLVRDGRDCADSLDRTYPAVLSDRVLASGSEWRTVGSEIGTGRRVDGFVIPWWVEDAEIDAFRAASRYARCLWMWERAVRLGRAAAEVDAARVLEIRYEELCRDPGATAERLLAFADVGRARRFRRALDRARSDSVGIARARPAPEAEIPPRAARLLEELGYDPGGPDPR